MSKQRNKSASRKRDCTSNPSYNGINWILLYMVCFWYIALDLPRYFVRRFLRVRATSDGGVHVWRSSSILLRRVFFSFAGYRKDLVSLLWIPAYVMESYPCSVPPIQSRFLVRNLSSLTRWHSCLYELFLCAADGAGFLVCWCSMSFTTSPSAKSCS